MKMASKVLVIDDEASIRESVEMFLREKGVSVHTAGTGAEGMQAWLKYQPQVIILDIRLPDVSGLEILKRISGRDPDVKVIMITAYHDMETTIEAMRHGAYDYIHKPLDVDELDRAVTRSLHMAEASLSTAPFAAENHEDLLRRRIVGRNSKMRSVFKTIGLLSRNRATVLIEGETGTGKELIARVIHESSAGSDQPFVTVDCTTLVETLLESELFGHERGAFTGALESKKGRLELAGEGTIFLDEVGDLPFPLQAKLLRFLESREFTPVGATQAHRSEARIIAASNKGLDELVQLGRFRHDLLFRLKVITIRVPPLRERMDDLPELVQFFVAKINGDLGTSVSRIENTALERLKDHSWPGNVRELKNVLTQAVLDSRGGILLRDTVEAALAGSSAEVPETHDFRSLDTVEKEHILKIIAQTSGNLSAAAKMLGLSRPTLRERLRRYGLRS
ncbi:MAG TPA: sigma-54 dependent transcriptional regulator [Desulfomonilaceae bacterium]|nr:sigma-54 dependent transcriptional regulator [Desulfomonilaceae bacterium]